jgi:hypothetical protein
VARPGAEAYADADIMANSRPIHLEQIPRNLGSRDRGARIALGATLLGASLGGWVDGQAALGLFLFAWVPVVTGLAGWCPVYQLFGFTTRRR